jgi:hypothetical protein
MANSAEFHLEFPVGCLDAVGRRRAVRVIPESSQVFLVAPAGESARLTTGQVVALQNALGLAQLAAAGGEL